MGLREIRKCCICGEEIQFIYEIPFRDLIGLERIYTEKIGICKQCGYILNMNPFTEEQLEKRYKEMSKYELLSEPPGIFEENSSYIKRSNRHYRYIQEHTKSIDSVFEVGASTGYNLGLWKEKGGCDVFGIEPSSLNKDIAKREYGVTLYDDTFQNYIRKEKGTKKQYDLIYLAGVLEHIVNPYQFMSHIKAFAGEYIFINIPTLDYKFKDEPFGMFVEEHVSIFTFQSLYQLMVRLGFCIVDCQIEFALESRLPAGAPCLISLWRKDKKAERHLDHGKMFLPVLHSELLLKEYLSASEKKEKEIEKKIDEIPDNVPMAVWGTGHHTSRLLATETLQRKNIVKFYDSDKRKKQFQMIGKQITEFCLEDVAEGKVQAILVSSYVAQNTIYRLLEPIKEQCQIVTLYP